MCLTTEVPPLAVFTANRWSRRWTALPAEASTSATRAREAADSLLLRSLARLRRRPCASSSRRPWCP
jgi:hypothetical protein